MASTQLARRLKAIAHNHEVLECPSPIHLGAFFYGYSLVVPGYSWLGDALDAQFPGPPQARAWTRAYLTFGNELGLTRAIDVAMALLDERQQPLVGACHGTPAMFVDVVLDAVRANRPATVLGESTIPWLYNFGLGSQAATSDYFSEIASERHLQLSRFETWLQGYFDSPEVPWQRILRAFEGPGERAVYRFASLWAEHIRVCQSSDS